MQKFYSFNIYLRFDDSDIQVKVEFEKKNTQNTLEPMANPSCVAQSAIKVDRADRESKTVKGESSSYNVIESKRAGLVTP